MWVRLDDTDLNLIRQRCPEFIDRLDERTRDDQLATAQQAIGIADRKGTTFDDIAVDGDAAVSIGESGIWVMGWLFVSGAEIDGFEMPDEEEPADA